MLVSLATAPDWMGHLSEWADMTGKRSNNNDDPSCDVLMMFHLLAGNHTLGPDSTRRATKSTIQVATASNPLLELW